MKKEESVTKWVFIILIMLIWYWFRKDAGDYYIHKPKFEILCALALYYATEFVIWKGRYYMSQVCVNNFSGSILGRPIPKGKYAIFNCGEVIDPIHFRGKIATLVVPKDQLRKAGRNYVGLTFVKKTPLLLLPTVVHRFLYHHESEYNLDNVYFGEYSEKFLEANEELPDYEEEKLNMQKQLNVRDRMIEGDDDLMVEKVKTAGEMRGDKPWWSFMKRKKDDDDE